MTQARPDLVVDRNAELARRYLVWLRDVRERRAVTIYNYGSKLDSFLAHIGDTPLAAASMVAPRQSCDRHPMDRYLYLCNYSTGASKSHERCRNRRGRRDRAAGDASTRWGRGTVARCRQR